MRNEDRKKIKKKFFGKSKKNDDKFDYDELSEKKTSEKNSASLRNKPLSSKSLKRKLPDADDLEIISAEEHPHESYFTFIDEAENEGFDKTRILTEEELRNLEANKRKKEETIKRKQKVVNKRKKDSKVKQVKMKAQEQPQEIQDDSGTGWVDDLLSDIIMDDSEESSSKNKSSVPISKKTVEAQSSSKISSQQSRKVSSSNIGANLTVEKSRTHIETEEEAIDSLLEEIDENSEEIPIISLTEEVHEETKDTINSTTDNLLSQHSSNSQNTQNKSEIVNLQEKISRLQIEVSEIMNIQTKMLKILLEFRTLFSKEDDQSGWWKRLSGRSKKK